MRLVPALAVGAFALLAFGCGPKESGKTDPTADKGAASGGELAKLEITDLKKGTGAAVASGDTVYVRYKGTFRDGRVFDQNMEGGKPLFNFTAGPMGTVIEGWKTGLIGMQVGGKRKLGVPWKLAYGEAGNDTIPAKTDLFFEIELVSMTKAGEENTVRRTDLKKGTGRDVKKGDRVKVAFVGRLQDGTEIDKGDYVFTVGKGEVIKGIDAGIVGMRQGGVRRLNIGPIAAFGPMGKPPLVPAMAPVVYEITLKGFAGA